jgi:adenosylcobyric acid synthase
VLGICGGFQMLCGRIDDPVESGACGVIGLGLLDADIAFERAKTLRHHDGRLRGYEIHHGRLMRSSENDWLGVGLRRAAVYGTHWHGLLDNDDVRRQWLTDAAAAGGRDGFVAADDVDVSARRDAQLDAMADLLAAHADIDSILGLLESGPPERPAILSSLRR